MGSRTWFWLRTDSAAAWPLAAARQSLSDVGVTELWAMAPAEGPAVRFLQRERFDVRPELVSVRLDVGRLW